MWHAGIRFLPLPERILGLQIVAGVVAYHHRLPVAPAGATADRVGDAHHGVAALMQALGVFRCGAVGDAFAVGVQRTASAAVVVAVEAKVEPGAEVKAGVRQHFDGHRRLLPSAIVQTSVPPLKLRLIGS